MLALKSYDVYVNGEFVHAESASTFDVVDPATGGSARPRAGCERDRVLFKLAEIVGERADELNVKQVDINLSEQPIGWY